MSTADLEEGEYWLDASASGGKVSEIRRLDRSGDENRPPATLLEKMRTIPAFVAELFQTFDDDASKMRRLVEFLVAQGITVAELQCAIKAHVVLVLITTNDAAHKVYIARIADMLDFLELLDPESARPTRHLLASLINNHVSAVSRQR